jgi:hypothetical protein
MKIDPDYTRDTLVRLIRTNSINPTLAPGAPKIERRTVPVPGVALSASERSLRKQ